MTRRQRYLGQALDHIREMEALQGERADTTRTIYGGLCHTLPILVRTNGLSQTIAFIQEKSGSADEARRDAYHALQGHIAQTLGVDTADQLLAAVHEATLTEYQRQTRTLLEAWVYYKRFATSFLGVLPGDQADEVLEEVVQ